MTLEELKRLISEAETAQAAHTADETDSFDILHACTQARLDLEDAAVTALHNLIAAVEALRDLRNDVRNVRMVEGQCEAADAILKRLGVE